MSLNVFNQKKPDRVMLFELLLIFISLAAAFGVLFQYFGLFQRFELETINHRFEARRWIKWSPIGRQRLDPQKIIDYHEKHEIPKRWWSWDYTLSWLIEQNHAPPALKIIVFNRLLEDEPPQEAVASHGWMKPLLQYPLPRETLAGFVSFLAASGVKAICLDYDFPQYSSGDDELARAICHAMNGKNGKPVPVILANTVHTVTAGNISQLHDPVTRSGVIRKIQEIDPSADAVEKYTGLTGVLQDEDQVVRRLVLSLRMPGRSPSENKQYDSVVVRILEYLQWPLPENLPEVIDVDFISVPNSAVYPVRPLSYLLDPDLRKKITSGDADDVSLKDAIVFIGDGISDLYDTPLTNLGLDRRSGSELLAQGLDTLARQSWLRRLSPTGSYIYVLMTALIGGLNFIIWRHLISTWRGRSSKRGAATSIRSQSGGDVSDLLIFLMSLISVYLIANLLFTFARLIVPVVVPAIAITLGMLVTVLWERDRIKVLSMEEQIRSSQEKLVLSHEKHEAELAYQASLAEQKANEEARRRRQDMVRRLNHDLKAPISVFNWTLAKLTKDRPESDPLFKVFERLKKSSEHLSNLLSEIVRSISDEADQKDGEAANETCEITYVLKKQSELEMSLAEITASRVVLDLPEKKEQVFVRGTELEVARIVDNIVGNALKHNAAGTTVTIKMEPCDWTRDYIQVSIGDDGKGISPDDLEKIFQAGFRAGIPRNEGEGLGLSIASSLVKKIGGDIDVESTLGKGTRFNIRLKLYKSAPQCENNLDESNAPDVLMSESSSSLENRSTEGDNDIHRDPDAAPILERTRA